MARVWNVGRMERHPVQRPSRSKIALNKPVCTVNQHTCQEKRSPSGPDRREENRRRNLHEGSRQSLVLRSTRESCRAISKSHGSREYTVKETPVKQKMSVRHFPGVPQLIWSISSVLTQIPETTYDSCRFGPAFLHNYQQWNTLTDQ